MPEGKPGEFKTSLMGFKTVSYTHLNGDKKAAKNCKMYGLRPLNLWPQSVILIIALFIYSGRPMP